MSKRVFLILYFTIVLCYAQAEELKFNYITVNDGLSQHDVSCILQDSQGFVWIGTYDGLNRFDGFTIKNFFSNSRIANSLSSNRIKCLHEDANKNLWIGTDGYGLNIFSLTTEKIIRIETPVGHEVINDFAENEDGRLLIATSNGLLEVDYEKDSIALKNIALPEKGMGVNDIQSNVSCFFIATSKGLWQYHDDEFTKIDVDGLSHFSVLLVESDSLIWANSISNLYRIDLSNNQCSIVAGIEPDVRAITRDKDGFLWIGTYNNGLYKVDPNTLKVVKRILSNKLHKKGLLSNSVLHLFCDAYNNLWIANRHGCCYADLSFTFIKNLPLQELYSSYEFVHIRCQVIHNNDLYFAVQNGGCYKMNLKTHSIQRLYLREGVFPLAMKVINNRVHLGASDGFYVLDNEVYFKNIPIEIAGNPNVFAMSVDKRGAVYLGTRQGIVRKDTEGEFIDVNELSDEAGGLNQNRIFCLYYDESKDCLWVGTISEGLKQIKFKPDGKVESITQYHTSLKNRQHIHNNTIWCIYQDDKRNLWLGTDLGLLYKHHQSDVFEWLEVDGIADKKIMGIIKDNHNHLWLNNSQGIIRYNPLAKEVTQYSYVDGLRSNTFTEAIDIDKEGTIYFGSIDGISSINPNDFKNDPVESKFLITDFRVHSKSVLPGKKYGDQVILNKVINAVDTIIIDHKHNNFLFEFSGSNFTKTSKNEFRYKLVGYDNSWMETNENHRFASYSNLKAGTYSFLAHIANAQGAWNQTPRQITVKVLPPPWLSLKAYVLYFLIISGLIIGLLYFLYYRQKVRHQLAMDQIQIKQQESLNEMKLTFFTDVAHEFKTPLSLIYGPVNELMNGEIIKEKKQLCLDVISRNTKRMMFLVNQLLDFRKIDNEINILKVGKGDFSEFITKTMQAFIWQAKNNQIVFSLNVPIGLICYFDHDVMEKVLFNIVSNAFKYTPKNGNIDVKVTADQVDNPNELIIVVRDSGKGIPDQEKDKIFERFFHGKERFASGIGLNLSYSLLKEHKGNIFVKDSKYGGAEFVIQLPVQKDIFESNELVDEVVFGGDIPIIESRGVLPLDSEDNKKDVDNILVVEDDNDLRAYLRTSLEGKYRVTEASNGKEGVEMAISILPDIIITDIMMPEMDGVEMCQVIRKNKKTSHIPILMLTAKTDEYSQNIGLNAGAWDYISKPFDTIALLQKISNIIVTRHAYRKQLLEQNITLEAKVHYTPYDQEFISKATKVVENNIDNSEFNPDSFALAVGLSRMQLHRKLKALSGQSTTSFVNSIKVKFASRMFDQGCDRIQEAMDAVGVNSHAHFNSMFKKVKGMTVAEYISSKK